MAEFVEFWVSSAWVLFFAALFLSTIVGSILSYHWIRFSMNPVIPTFAFVIYVSGCVLLLSTMFAAIVVQ